MKTSKKYTIILSAWQVGADLSTNFHNTSNLKNYIKVVMKSEVIEAVGHYKGGEEISFIVHTNFAQTVNHLKKHAINGYNQECVLVSSNKLGLIELHELHKFTKIGTKFVPGKGDGENYTRIQHGDYWSVA